MNRFGNSALAMLLVCFASAASANDIAMGRISVSCRVERRGVREEQVPATVAPEGVQAEQRLVAAFAPKLAGAFEAALVLAAGRLDGARAQGLGGFDFLGAV